MTTTVDRPTAAATGVVVRPWRAVWLRLEGQWTWYRRHWTASLLSSGLQPVLFLTAMGVGFGSQVRPGPLTGGAPYLAYVAPTILVSGLITIAVAEAGLPILSGFKWKQDYWAVASSPISPGQLFTAELLWITARLVLGAVLYLAVTALLGGWTGPGALLVAPIAVLAGAACATPIMAFAATTKGDGHVFAALNRFVVMPMTLFAGTFFPLDRLPEAVRPLAWISPLWHGNELARGAALGGLGVWPALGHLAVLIGLLGLGVATGRRRFQRRLVV
ncbi:lipooligosaccharide transport system permease protein [Actinokineospora baliensis]|uniref:ABC transporter permease n=1 Tax=Actinokineospora baliensis TaxID=547056 RepID=UPI00195706CA|nr:ABC transporter permease [Actinokineospora baliensis]MBM7776568.1 lipooligosaccharide transport system permease protein [Actinokineospora baliensis]